VSAITNSLHECNVLYFFDSTLRSSDLRIATHSMPHKSLPILAHYSSMPWQKN